MKRIFNIAGPCIPGKHYLLPSSERCPEITQLISAEHYFVIHAARQSGKTSTLNALEFELNSAGQYAALYCSLETVQGITDPKEGIPAIVRALLLAMQRNSIVSGLQIPAPDMADYNNALGIMLMNLCKALDKPLVILFDEADCLSDQTLITFLRQLRDGYVNRVRSPFPVSLALVGMRNIRDYKVKIRDDKQTLGSASPFNIITEALTLTNFTREEISTLYRQHTADTGQVFEETAIDRASYWTCGQPWLVNAVARECVLKLLNEDYTKPITAELIDQAAENILTRRDTHIDSLLERLKEERVRRIVEPVIIGQETTTESLLSDDTQYVLDLGILTQERGALRPSNPIYAEVILRTLSYDTQMHMLRSINNIPWITSDGLDMNGLLKAFQQFWRENSVMWQEIYQYKEAAPHLILQAFLQRVINGGGQIVREFALGNMRLDLLACFKSGRYPIEIKLKQQMRPGKAHEQLSVYMDTLGAAEGWLVVFDRTKKPWSRKITWKTGQFDGKTIHIVGC